MGQLIQVGLAATPSEDYLAATAPLFDADEVDVIEWSFDVTWGKTLPHWCETLLTEFSDREALLGHGVTFSLLSAQLSDRQQTWLQNLHHEFQSRRYNHLTEHFGFMTAGAFTDGAPLPVPLTETSVAIGLDRLERLSDATNVPIGLENLAFAFCSDDVSRQGEFLDRLLSPVNGFLLLDLHNIYCQSVNFNIPARELLSRYPLDRVHEIHISGGSWSNRASNNQNIRRDTHDDAVPLEVFDLLTHTLDVSPNVQYVILERLEGTMPTSETQFQFAEDFRRTRQLVKQHG